MTDSNPEQAAGRWGGRLAAIVIAAFIVGVLILMFFAVRGPS